MSFTDRLKQIGEAAKGIMLFIITPFIIIVVSAYYLVTKNKSLQADIEQLKSNGKVIRDKEIADEKDKQAAVSLDAYRKSRDEYLKGGK